MIGKIRKLNQQLLQNNVNNPRELNKQKLIEKILSEKNCFLKMSIEDAYSILRDLKIPEDQIKDVYFNLIDPEIE
ncbi:MAG: hypothetical protein V8Q75_00065 [Bacilli bacterium]